jgi:hypothetical protein
VKYPKFYESFSIEFIGISFGEFSIPLIAN